MDSVSCIITTHNRLELLKRAVNSVLNQSYPNKELIIVDDASEEDTKKWVKNLVDNTTFNIKYIYIPKNQSKGGNYARNLGIKTSTGNLIAFLDDDDEWLPNKLDEQVKVISKDDECVLVYGNRIIENIDRNGNASYKQFPLNPKYKGDVSSLILTDIFTTTSLILVKKDALFKIGLFDENLRFWQEYELSIRLAQIGSFHYVDKPLIKYRVDTFDSQRLTNKYYEWKGAVKYVRKKHAKLYKKLSLFDRIRVKALIWRDSYYREKACGMKLKAGIHKKLLFGYKVITSVQEGTFIKKIRNNLKRERLFPSSKDSTKCYNKKYVTFLEFEPFRLGIQVLNKFRLPINKPYFKAIHYLKKRKIKNLIPNSLKFLKSGMATMESNHISKELPIYFLWLQGKDEMPPIVKLCAQSIENNRGNHQINFIDNSNLKEIITNLPEFGEKILKWYENDVITIQYLSDILRSGLLSSRGGIWTDATLLFIKPIDDVILNLSFYSLKRTKENINWHFVANNRWTAFFLSSQKNNLLMGFLYRALVEVIDNFGAIPDYFTIDYILAIAYDESSEVKAFIDNLPAIKPNLGKLMDLGNGVVREDFNNRISSSPVFKLDWRIPVLEKDGEGKETIYSRLKSYIANGY